MRGIKMTESNLTTNLMVIADTFICLTELRNEYSGLMIDGTMRITDLNRIDRLIKTASEMLAMGGIDPEFHLAVKREWKRVCDCE